MEKILVVEDNAEYRRELTEELQDAGYKVLEATNGEEGLKEILSNEPDMVLCDVAMPVMNGHRLLVALREEHQDHAELPFIFLSAHNEKSDVLEGLGLGADDYLSKPVDFDLLQMKVKALLRQVSRMKEQKKREQVKLFKSLSKTAAASAQSSPPNPEQSIDSHEKPAHPPELEKLIDQCRSHNASASAGKIQFINLRELKTVFGDKWEKLAEKAIIIAESIIQNHLSPKEAFYRHEDDAIILLFPSLGQVEASSKAGIIADEIRARLLGTDTETYKNLSISAATADLNAAFDTQGEFSIENLYSSLRTGQETDEDHYVPVKSDASVCWFIEQLGVSYSPVWNAKKSMVMGYHCCPHRTTGYGVLSGHNLLHGGGDDPLAVELDAFVITQVIGAAKKIKGPNKAVVSFPLHFNSLIGENADRLAESLMKFNSAFPTGALTAEITGIPESLSESKIGEAMHFLKSYFKFVGVKLSPDSNHATKFHRFGATFIGLDLSESDHGNPQMLHVILKDFARKAANIGFESYVHNVDSISELRTTIEEEFLMVNGKTIGAEIQVPTSAYPLNEKGIIGY